MEDLRFGREGRRNASTNPICPCVMPASSALLILSLGEPTRVSVRLPAPPRRRRQQIHNDGSELSQRRWRLVELRWRSCSDGYRRRRSSRPRGPFYRRRLHPGLFAYIPLQAVHYHVVHRGEFVDCEVCHPARDLFSHGQVVPLRIVFSAENVAAVVQESRA